MASLLRRRKNKEKNPQQQRPPPANSNRPPSMPKIEEKYKFVFVKLSTGLIFFMWLLMLGGTWYNDSSQKAVLDVDQYAYLWYDQFIDINSFALVGFGFSMTYLRRYGFSSLSTTLFIIGFCIPYGSFANGLVDYIFIGLVDLDQGRYSGYQLAQGVLAGIATLISYGILLGRINPSQVLCQILLEVIFWTVNAYINVYTWGLHDVGQSINVHLFGTCFGYAISWIMEPPWLYWPSFNGYFASNEYYFRDRAYINTILALCGSTFGAFFMSRLVTEIYRSHKFDIQHIQSATLAGGVAIGTAADLYLTPAAAIGVGVVAGIFSVFGYVYLTDKIESGKLKIADTRGIINIHGFPAILSGCVAAVALALAAPGGIYVSSEHPDYPFFWDDLKVQAAYTLIAMCTTIGLGLFGGGLTGWMMVLLPFPNSEFEDSDNFRVFMGISIDKDPFRETIRGPRFGINARQHIHVLKNEQDRQRSPDYYDQDTLRMGNVYWNHEEEDLLQNSGGIQVLSTERDTMLGDEDYVDRSDWRHCIENDIMPDVNTISYARILRDYYFDEEEKDPEEAKEDPDEDEMFYPWYDCAKVQTRRFDVADGVVEEKKKSDDTETDEYEYYLTTKLKSNVNVNKFKRKNLNLVVALDTQSAVDSEFESELEVVDDTETVKQGNKSEYLAELIVGMIENQLTSSDRIGVVALCGSAQVLQPLVFTNKVDLNQLNKAIVMLQHDGGEGTSQQAYKKSIDLFHNAGIDYNENFENRVIFVTVGLSDADGEYGAEEAANNEDLRIYTTLLGVGIGMTQQLKSRLSIRGSNLISVRSSAELRQYFEDAAKFTSLVTPIFFNINLKLKCLNGSCQIDEIYGSSNEKYNQYVMRKGNIMKIHTLFASSESLQIVQSGILLIKLKPLGANKSINATIVVSYEDREESEYVNEKAINFRTQDGTCYDTRSIRKSVLLCKYAKILKEWLEDEAVTVLSMSKHALAVNDRNKLIFKNFCAYFENEMKECNDSALNNELLILRKLAQI